MGRVNARAEAVALRYGGRVDKLMGDVVLVVFGDPVAHEDDAERAVRAALELHAAVDAMRPALESLTGSSFQMHSGIDSGMVVTGDMHGDRASGPLGDMVNVAALREVSVVGREFLYRLVRSVSTDPDDLDRSLSVLSAADLIREKSADPELEYVFKHGLTQEVAYEGLLRRDRQQLHELVGRAIESQLGDRVDEFVETLAYHFQRSRQLSMRSDTCGGLVAARSSATRWSSAITTTGPPTSCSRKTTLTTPSTRRPASGSCELPVARGALHR